MHEIPLGPAQDLADCGPLGYILCHSPVCKRPCDEDMKLISEQIRLAATDLSNHLACRHVTTLDLQVVRGEKRAPDWADPNGTVLRERGERHEAAYLTYLAEQKKLAV